MADGDGELNNLYNDQANNQQKIRLKHTAIQPNKSLWLSERSTPQKKPKRLENQKKAS